MKIDPAAWAKLELEFRALNLKKKKVEQLNEVMKGNYHDVAFRIDLVRASSNSSYYSKKGLVGTLSDATRPLSASLSKGAARGAEALSLGSLCSPKRSTDRNTNTAEMKRESGKRVVESKRSRLDNIESKLDVVLLCWFVY